jgi:hypothetical protein
MYCACICVYNEEYVVVHVDAVGLSLDCGPPTDVLSVPQVIHEYGESLWNDIDGENR